MHGSGVMVFANGKTYDGGFQRAKKHGDGVYTYPSGER